MDLPSKIAELEPTLVKESDLLHQRLLTTDQKQEIYLTEGDHMSGNYLIHGTNALKDALRYVNLEKFMYEYKSVQIYLAVACTTLSHLEKDEEALEKITNGMNTEPNEIYRQFEDFVEEFIKPDQALLMAAGMDEKMGQYLFNDLSEMQGRMQRENNDKNASNITCSLLKEKIKELKYSVCEDKKRGEIKLGRTPLWRGIRLIGGAAIITTNTVADQIIGPLASAYSSSFGGFIVSKGLDG